MVVLDRPALVVAHASQTGTAEGVAMEIADAAHARGYQVQLLNLQNLQPAALAHLRLLVAVVATAGDGEPPDALASLWAFLRRADLPIDALTHLHYATFGCGDSSYPKFNYAAKKFHKRLSQLGATPLAKLGLGDEQDALGLDHAFFPWCNALWPALAAHWPSHLPPPQLQQPEADSAPPPPRYRVEFCHSSAAPAAATAPADPAHPHSRDSPFRAAVLSNRPLTPAGASREVRHIELNLVGSGLESYAPGDALAVQPRNPAAAAEGLARALGFDPSSTIVIEPAVPHAPAPSRSVLTVGELFAAQLDAFGVPRRRFFALLAHFASDPMQATRLAEFGSPSGTAGRDEYATRPRRTYAEVLADFRSARPPLAYFLDLIPPLRERYFSLASSPAAHPGRAHICVAVVRYRSMLEAPRLGVASNYLASLGIGDTVGVWLRRGCLRLPRRSDAPLLMVGPGTGVAPFRAFVQERAAALAAGGVTAGGAMLLFGCRDRSLDFLYADEWEQYVRSGALTELVTAFSREGERKVYVQHRLGETDVGARAWEILRAAGSHVYIAGAAGAMPKGVLGALKRLAQVHGRMSEEDAAGLIRSLESSGRLQTECW